MLLPGTLGGVVRRVSEAQLEGPLVVRQQHDSQGQKGQHRNQIPGDLRPD